MKPALLACGITLATIVSAAAAPVVWQGEFMITSKVGCDLGAAGGFAAARFLPGIGGQNGNDSYLNLFSEQETRGYKLVNNLFGGDFLSVETIYVGNAFGPFTAPVNVRFNSQKPAVVGPDTIDIDVKGRIRNYDGILGCLVDFKLTLMRRETSP
jgi:hypothetical protein